MSRNISKIEKYKYNFKNEKMNLYTRPVAVWNKC